MVTRSALTLLVKPTATTDRPWLDVEVSVLMFWTVAIASSIGRVICVSTVAGSAPGSVVDTTAVGWVMFGTIEMLSVK
jgi:hypothetical protein